METFSHLWKYAFEFILEQEKFETQKRFMFSDFLIFPKIVPFMR